MMNGTDFVALLPLLISAYAGVILMVIVAFLRSNSLAFGITLFSLAAAFGSVFAALQVAPRVVTPLIRIDAFSLYFSGLVIAGALLVTLFCRQYFPGREKREEALYVLVMFSVLGMLVLVSSIHFISFFLGLETLTVSLYGLIGYTRNYRPSLEGAVKYLILAATSSAFLLFGIALVYADTGTMDFRRLAPMMIGGAPSAVSFFGITLVIVAFAYKLALAPFHMWSPDVYQGAPAPVTALIATGSKGAVFALLLRWVTLDHLAVNPKTFLVIAFLSVATMFVGNLLALLQANVKRLLAYSSVAHMGYLLIPLAAGGPRGPSSIAFYLVSYFATTIAAFGVVAVISTSRPAGDIEEIEDYGALGYRNPVLGAILGLALLSLTGIPLTSGFFAKFYIFTAGIESNLWALVILGVINSGISAYYYLRLLLSIYAPIEPEPEPLPGAGPAATVALAVSTVAMLYFGLYPSQLIRLAQATMRAVGFP